VVWKGIDVPYQPLRTILGGAGLLSVDRGRIPIPFENGRHLAKALGLNPRMPSSESESRIRGISEDVLEWSFQRLGEVARREGVVPVVLALNAVIEDAPAQVPNQGAIRNANLTLIDLFHVYPAERRAALRVAPWDDHPNAEGHKLIADRLYPELLKVVGSRGVKP
jgi:hypothetical protein